MSDLQEQLAALRKRMKMAAARADRIVAARPRPVPAAVEQWLAGEVVETAKGTHFESERVWESRKRHGSVQIDDLRALAAEHLSAISEGEIESSDPSRWAFLDTETTGIAGGSGTCAFLVGVGRITPEGFRVKQFFMRDFGEESSQLHALAEHLTDADTLITYNGKAFDIPLLETRYRMARARPPFARSRSRCRAAGGMVSARLEPTSTSTSVCSTSANGKGRPRSSPNARLEAVAADDMHQRPL